jgi:hypothetical protein
VLSVKVDGAIVPPASYRVVGDEVLRRIDGESWPRSQNLDIADTEPDTFSVTFTYGREVPIAGQRAAAALACQLGLALNPATADKCKLPKRITSITRQGVSWTVIDPWEFLDKGKVGIYDVDVFLAGFNPNRLQRRAVALSPDTR